MRTPQLDRARGRRRSPDQDRSSDVVTTQASDDDLIQRAQFGERGAFDLLVRKYQRRILSLALRYTRNLSDAEDASQETFINAYRGLRGFRGACTFYTWLHRIAINCAKDVLTARARDALFWAASVPDNDRSAELAARQREVETPEQLSVTGDIQRLLIAALAVLPEAHRMAITYREIDGLTYQEIAAATATPIGTVRSRVYRARETIDRKLRLAFDGGLGRRSRRRARVAANA
jgi:RNA polymerase sigma-70 factor (ECF subfamily)